MTGTREDAASPRDSSREYATTTTGSDNDQQHVGEIQTPTAGPRRAGASTIAASASTISPSHAPLAVAPRSFSKRFCICRNALSSFPLHPCKSGQECLGHFHWQCFGIDEDGCAPEHRNTVMCPMCCVAMVCREDTEASLASQMKYIAQGSAHWAGAVYILPVAHHFLIGQSRLIESLRRQIADGNSSKIDPVHIWQTSAMSDEDVLIMVELRSKLCAKVGLKIRWCATGFRLIYSVFVGTHTF